MAIPALASDFKEFLKLIGGYAVGIYGHIRATNDLDIWVNVSLENAARIDHALRQFGFAAQSLTPDLFLARNNVVRMGVPPVSEAGSVLDSGNYYGSSQVGRAPWPARDALVPLLEAGRKPQCASHTKRCQTVPT